MIFLQKLKKELNSFKNHQCEVKDNVQLYGVQDRKPPIATHLIFAPMPKDVMQSMVDSYKNSFPKELLSLYSTMNGADLFWSFRILGERKMRIPFCRLSIYGIPLTEDRQHIEPFNICIEDLNRPNEAPDTWLKFGSYYNSINTADRLDLYADTETGYVYSIQHDNIEFHAMQKWESIDECLSCIFDSLHAEEQLDN